MRAGRPRRRARKANAGRSARAARARPSNRPFQGVRNTSQEPAPLPIRSSRRASAAVCPRTALAELGSPYFHRLDHDRPKLPPRARTVVLDLEDGATERQARLDLAPIVSAEGLATDAPQFCTDLRNEPFDKGELAEEMVAAVRRADSVCPLL